MKLQKFFHFCAKIGFWPFRYETDGKIRIVWLYLLYVIAGITFYALLTYRLIPMISVAAATPRTIGEVAFGIQAVGVYIIPFLIFQTRTTSGQILTTSTVAISYWEVIGSVVTVAVLDFSFLGMRYRLLCETGFQPYPDVMLVVGMAIMDTAVFTSAFLLLAIFCLNLEFLMDDDSTGEKFTVEKVHRQIKNISHYQGIMSMIGWPMFLMFQLFIIMATFMMVSDLSNLYMVLYVLDLSLIMVVFISKLEHFYDLVRDAAIKIRNESVEAGTVKE